jgi:starch phosphorylase
VTRSNSRAGRSEPPQRPTAAEVRAHLLEIGNDLRWSWYEHVRAVFSELDREAWDASGQNPIRFLRELPNVALTAALDNQDWVDRVRAFARDFEEYRNEDQTWWRTTHPQAEVTVAYFSAEFSIADSLPIFAGGLGAVAGEHLKSASALGVPIVGVGLLYRETSHQWLDEDRRQQESWELLDTNDLPLAHLRDTAGTAINVQVPIDGTDVACRVWKARIGRVRLLLLDADSPENPPWARAITRRLYGGDLKNRIRQELLLGVGGMRALRAAGIRPDVIHCNEGHSTFALLEAICQTMEDRQCEWAAAQAIVNASSVFTTHTPVAAGHDYFPPVTARNELKAVATEMQRSLEQLLRLGRYTPEDQADSFCPTVLGLRLAGRRNGVSPLHARVTRQQWGGLWPRVPEHEVPVVGITNGIHYQTWLSPEMDALLHRTFGPSWRTSPLDASMWLEFQSVDSAELWEAMNTARIRLVRYARTWLQQQRKRRNADAEVAEAQLLRLHPQTLTIGFVGRFVEYKRPTLFLHDRDRFARILSNANCPVQIVFAGKAHPKDHAGKALLSDVVAFARDCGLSDRVVFLEDFDMAMDRHLTQGVDVWLNTPRRPLEACGISGMKAGANGALNLSTIDGWWDLAWTERDREGPPIGWSIGDRIEYEDHTLHDANDAESLYTLLETEVVPSFYQRDGDGIPQRWIQSLKQSIATLSPMWNSHRMVQEYVEHAYLPALQDRERLTARRGRAARAWATLQESLRDHWHELSIEDVDVTPGAEHFVVTATLRLGSISPKDLLVQAWIHPEGEQPFAYSAPMKLVRKTARQPIRFQLDIPNATLPSGVVAVRVLPNASVTGSLFDSGLIYWSYGVPVEGQTGTDGEH